MSEVKVDTISERTAANGVAVDGVTIKDSGLTIPSGGTLTVASGGTITNSGTATGFGGDNTPSFYAWRTSSQTIPHNTWTTLAINNELWDTDSAYDASSSYTFTVPAGEGGKYVFHAGAGIGTSSGYETILAFTGSTSTGSLWPSQEGFASGTKYATASMVADLAAGDTVYVRGYQYTGSSQSGSYFTFAGFKLIGV